MVGNVFRCLRLFCGFACAFLVLVFGRFGVCVFVVFPGLVCLSVLLCRLRRRVVILLFPCFDLVVLITLILCFVV